MTLNTVFPAALISAAQNAAPGPIDEARFQRLYADLAPALLGYVARISGDGIHAEDLLQETFIRLLQADVGHLTDPQLRAYLYRTATNLVRDRWRASQRHPVVEMPVEPAAAAPSLTPLDIPRLFGKLTVRERSLLWLAYVEGCGHREIAARLGVSTFGVRVSLFRARKRFAAVLVKGGFSQ